MGYEKGRGLGKNLQGRALPIQVIQRQGKGAIGRYGNEDPNRVQPTEGNHDIIFFGLSNPFSSHLESDVSKGSSKKGAAPSAPQWRKQPREVLSFNTLFLSLFAFFFRKRRNNVMCIKH